MSLPKKDVRVWLDHDTHAALLAICETTEGVPPAHLAADILTSIIRKRVHAASLVVKRLEASGSLEFFADEEGSE